MSKPKYLLIALLIISELVYCILYSGIYHPVILFTAVSIINSVIFISIIYMIKMDKLPDSVFILIVFGIIFRITVFFQPITASDDIFRYMWDGKVQYHNVNPYKFAPESNELDSLHSDLIPVSVNHPDIKTIYPPFSQYIFYISYHLFEENYYGFKIILLLFELVTILLIFLILKNLNIRKEFIGIYSLCPLPVMQFMVDGHVDAVGITLLIAGLYFFIKKRFFISYLFLGFSVASKLITGMVLPYLSEKKVLKLVLIISIPVLIFAATYIPYISPGVNPFESLATFTKDWTFNGSLFEIFYRLVNDNQDARKITAVIFILSGIILFFSKREMPYKVVLIFFLFLLLNPTVHPWYVTWLAALLAFNFRWSGIAFITLINLAHFTVINYRLNAIWSMPDYILIIEYLPVYVLLSFELFEEIRSGESYGKIVSRINPGSEKK